MSASRGWYATQSNANPDLFRVIFDFNRRPQHWVHPAVVAALPHAPVVTALAGSRHRAGHLSAWMMQELRLLEHGTCWDFEEPRRRVTLLSPPSLERLARYCGATLHWPGLRNVIGRQEVQDLKSLLGDEARTFALRRGGMIVPEKEALSNDGGNSLAVQALNDGWDLLLAAAHDEDAAVRSRFELKLPAEVAKRMAAKATPEQRDGAWKRLWKVSAEILTEGELKCFA